MNTTQKYELYIIFRPDAEAQACEDKINEFLTNIKAEEINIEREGARKMAYPIKKQINGQYYLVNFDLSLENAKLINSQTYRLNKDDKVLRQLITNITDFLKQKAKEKLNPSPETTNQRDLNKGKGSAKKCIVNYLGFREIDYKDVEFLNQFTSPYSKIFPKTRTGNKAKNQRKVTQAIKRARHMALMSFTAKYLD
jgi:small subunit ribosomal protein S18